MLKVFPNFFSTILSKSYHQCKQIYIFFQGNSGPFQRPWQSPVPPLEKSSDLEIKYPADDESNGIFCVAWRGASAVRDQYTVTATALILKYLSDFSVSPLQKELVEIEDPYASEVSTHYIFFFVTV